MHFESPAGDKVRANTFYQSAFGWTLIPMQGMDYTSAITAPSDEQTGMPSAPGAINGAPGQGRRSRHGLVRLFQGHRRQHHGPLADGFLGGELSPGQDQRRQAVTLYL